MNVSLKELRTIGTSAMEAATAHAVRAVTDPDSVVELFNILETFADRERTDADTTDDIGNDLVELISAAHAALAAADHYDVSMDEQRRAADWFRMMAKTYLRFAADRIGALALRHVEANEPATKSGQPELLADVAADPVAWAEPYAHVEEGVLARTAEELTRLHAEACRDGRDRDAQTAKVALDHLIGQEQRNRDAIRAAAKEGAERLRQASLAELVSELDEHTDTAVRLRSTRGYVEVMDPAARIATVLAGLCRSEIHSRGKWLGEGNSPGNPF